MTIITPDYPIITVGIKELKSVKVYPLSFADARKLKTLLLGLIKGTADLKAEQFTPLQVASWVISVIEENISIIANMVLSEPVEEEELSIEQVAQIADIVYTMNEGAVKNLLGLWKKFRTDNLPKAENQ